MSAPTIGGADTIQNKYNINMNTIVSISAEDATFSDEDSFSVTSGNDSNIVGEVSLDPLTLLQLQYSKRFLTTLSHKFNEDGAMLTMRAPAIVWHDSAVVAGMGDVRFYSWELFSDAIIYSIRSKNDSDYMELRPLQFLRASITDEIYAVVFSAIKEVLVEATRFDDERHAAALSCDSRSLFRDLNLTQLECEAVSRRLEAAYKLGEGRLDCSLSYIRDMPAIDLCQSILDKVVVMFA